MIRVGPAGWSYADWERRVYPRPKPASFHPLPYLARYVGCIEINSTFYAYPRPDYASNWSKLVSDKLDFRFLAKLHRDFTHGPHDQSEADLDRLATNFIAGIDPLVRSGQLAAVLLQFPISFVRSAETRHHLERLRRRFDTLPLVFELRHRSWFDPLVLEKFAQHQLSVAHIDLPYAKDHPDAGHRRTGPIGYLRLHGRNSEHWFRRESTRDQRYDYLYAPEELDQLVERARRLEQDHDQVFVVTNNHFEGQALANAIEILSLLAGGPVPAPPALVTSFPRLAPITHTERDPGALF